MNWWMLTKFIVVIISQHIQISNHYIVHLCCCCCSVANSCPTLCDPMNCTSGFPVLHYLPEFAQTHVHWVNDVIQLKCPSSVHPASPALSLSQHQGFSNESALFIRWPKYWSFSFSISPFNEIQCWFPLGLTGLIYLFSKGLSRVFYSTTIQKHQFFSAQPSLCSCSHICIWPLEKP